MLPAFYDPTISYEDNYQKGPPVFSQDVIPPQRLAKEPTYEFFGNKINIPFGIPPGPLLNSNYMKAAFEWGFDVSTYKTVRANVFPCHPYPNVLFVDTPKNLYPEHVLRLVAHKETKRSPTEYSITNSFGVPSKSPEEWQEDVKKALTYVGKGQLLILSFMGTVRENQTEKEFIDDFVLAATLSRETGAKVLEANLSCPNIGNEGLVCYNLDMTEKVCKAIRHAIQDTPFIIKIGHYQSEEELSKLAAIANDYTDGVASINTLQVEVVDEAGNQALPGKNRLRSGVCGASIKWAGLDMTKKLNRLRETHHFEYKIIGIGGVMTAEDFFEYREAGADLVQSATGAMWNPLLAHEIEERIYIP